MISTAKEVGCFDEKRSSNRSEASKFFDVVDSSEEIHSSRVFSLRKSPNKISTKENASVSNFDCVTVNKNDCGDNFQSKRVAFQSKRDEGFGRKFVENVHGERARLACSSASDDDDSISDISNSAKTDHNKNDDNSKAEETFRNISSSIPTNSGDISPKSLIQKNKKYHQDVVASERVAVSSDILSNDGLSGHETSSDGDTTTESKTNNHLNNSAGNFPFFNFRTGFPITLPTWMWMKK